MLREWYYLKENNADTSCTIGEKLNVVSHSEEGEREGGREGGRREREGRREEIIVPVSHCRLAAYA